MVDYRQERKALKQQLFTIRRYVEGERVKMTKELKDLRAKYEALPNFTRWQDFPDKWDIGDPHGVKDGAFAFDELMARNFKKARGKGYDVIVALDQPDYPAQLLEEWQLALLNAGLAVGRVRPTDHVRNLVGGYLIVTLGGVEYEGEELELTCRIHFSNKQAAVTLHTSNPSDLEHLELVLPSDAYSTLSAWYDLVELNTLLTVRDTLTKLGCIDHLQH